MAIRLHGTAGSWTLPTGTTVVGRGEGCQIRLQDPRLSRRHAQIVVAEGGAVVEDLGSPNPVLLNGDRVVSRAPLTQGDALVIGPFLLRIEINQAAQPAGVSVTAATAVPGEAPPPPPSPRRATQAMAPEEIATLAEDSRQAKALDPEIAAALGRPPTRRHLESTTSRHLPSAWPPEPVSGALAATPAVISHPPPGAVSKTLFTPREAQDPTSALTPGGIRRPRLPPLVGRRVAAMAVDVLGLGALALVAALLPLVAGLSHACRAVGQAPPLTVGEGWATIQALWGQTAAFPGLFLGLSGAAIAIELVLLLGTVAATVRLGAPWGHRRLGLVIVVKRNGHHLGWLRSLVRWTLLGLLAPVSVFTIWRGGRSLHDRWTGCEVRSKNT